MALPHPTWLLKVSTTPYFRFVLAATLTYLVVLGGCGNRSSMPSPKASDDLRPSAAVVADGLRQIDETATAIAAAVDTDKSRAKALSQQLQPLWISIEGTVKANDPHADISLENDFAALETAADTGDATKARSRAAAISQIVVDYLRKYPG